MIKTITIGQKINGVAQTSKLMMLSGDKILLVDATTGLPPKKVTTKMVGKDLHIFADGATEPSAILGDYSEFSASSTVQGIAHNGAYYNYIPTDAGVMELSSSPVAPAVAKESSFISSAGWWGLGILALGGGVAAAAGGGGGGGSSATTTTPTGTTQTAVLVDDVLIGVSYTTSSGLSGKTGSDGSFSFKPGDTVTFKVGNATLGSFTPTVGDLVVTISDLAGNDVTKTENLAKFLQSLDSDTNASTITISTATANSITTAANVQDDPTAGGQVTITVTNPDLGALTDTTAPSATIVLSDYTLNQGETALVTITFTEAVSGLTNADVTVENGSLTALSTADGGITWTATFTPTANLSDTTNVITLANASYIDQAGNQGSGSSTANYVINTLTPAPTPFTLTISDDESAVGNIVGGSITYTFSFAKEVTGFSADDINVTGGTKGTFSGSGSSYTLIVTPTPLLEGNITVSVSAGVATATDGSQNLASSSTQTIDMLAPSILTMALAEDSGTIDSDKITSNSTINITTTPETNAIWEYSLNSGSTWNTGSGTSFTLADNTSYAIDAIQIRQTDAAGNISPVAKNAEAITIDIKAPTLTISDNEPSETANMDGSNGDSTGDTDGADIRYTFTFDEDVSGFDLSDINIDKGTAKTFTKLSAKEYTLGVTPDLGYEGAMTISVNANSYTDIAGNIGISYVESSQIVDMLAPVLVSTVAHSENDTIILTFDKELETVNMVEVKDSGRFEVFINGVKHDVQAVAMLGLDVTLVMSDANQFESGVPVRIVYKDETGDLGPSIQDKAGNDATSFRSEDVVSIDPIIAEPVIDLAQDTGIIGDLITNNTIVNVVSTDPTTVTWQYSVDGMGTWLESSSPNSFSLQSNTTYAGGSIVVRTIDAFGNKTLSKSFVDDVITDTTAPKLIITDDEQRDVAPKAGGNINYTFTFDSEIMGLSASDIIVEHGVKGSFSQISEKVYQLGVIPESGYEGMLNVSVAANTYTDIAGNSGFNDVLSSQQIDMKVPVLDPTHPPVASNSADSVTFTFNDILDGGNPPDTTNFYATDGSTTTDPATGKVTINSIKIAGIEINDYTLTVFMEPMVAGDWKVTYKDIPGDSQYALQDINGNDVSGFSYSAAVL